MGLEEYFVREKGKILKRKDHIYYPTICFLKGFFYLMGYKISVEGAGQLPKDRGAIIVFNHVSMLDPLVMMCVSKRPINSVGKKELFGIPGWTWLITACGAYPIDRFNKDVGMNRRALIYSRDLLELDEIVSLAPGATRSLKIGKIRPKMLISLERRVSCQIIVCGIHYSDPKNLPKWGSSIDLHFSEYNIKDSAGELKAEGVIAEELGQLLSELSGLPFDPSFDALGEKYQDLVC